MLLSALYLVAVPQAYAAGDVDLLMYDKATLAAPAADAPPAELAPIVPPDMPPIGVPASIAVVNPEPKPLPPLEVAPPVVRRPAPKKEPSLAAPAKPGFAPEDSVMLKIDNEPDISGNYMVLKDGTVNLPLIGSVAVAGKTPAQVKNLLVAKYKDGYLVNPQITVTAGAGP